MNLKLQFIRLGCMALALASSVILHPGRAFAWGDDGHRIVCDIAYSTLDRETAREVARLVRLYRPPSGSSYTFYSQSCTFADAARIEARNYTKAKKAGDEAKEQRLRRWARFNEFSNWHFLNLSRTEDDVTAADCEDDCVLFAIARHKKELADKSLPDWKRAEALMLLGHWVGDLHQPLHVSYSDDLGGNSIDDIRGGYYGNPNLHSVWDSGIISVARGHDWWTYSRKLRSTITDQEKGDWVQSTPLDWANESYDIATEADVRYCRPSETSCDAIGAKRTLDSSYQAKFQPVVEDRLKKGGVRLAHLIAEALRN